MTKEKLLVLSQGSPNDPKYSDQKAMLNGEELEFHEYFRRQGIKLPENDVVNSCHGNIRMTLDITSDIGKLVKERHKVVAIQQGGLYFAKPSIEAADIPMVPIISVPLDEVAFFAPHLPTGTATVGGVLKRGYQTAAYAAAQILLNEFEGVYTYGAGDKMKRWLDKLGVPILGEATEGLEKGLVVGTLKTDSAFLDMAQLSRFDNMGTLGIMTFDTNSFRHQSYLAESVNPGLFRRSIYARGEENVAIMAAKCMAANNPTIEIELVKMALQKAGSYTRPGLRIEDFR